MINSLYLMVITATKKVAIFSFLTVTFSSLVISLSVPETVSSIAYIIIGLFIGIGIFAVGVLLSRSFEDTLEQDLFSDGMSKMQTEKEIKIELSKRITKIGKEKIKAGKKNNAHERFLERV